MVRRLRHVVTDVLGPDVPLCPWQDESSNWMVIEQASKQASGRVLLISWQDAQAVTLTSHLLRFSGFPSV